MRRVYLLGLILFCSTLTAQTKPAAMSAIRQADLERDMRALAGDEMRGREAGTLDEMRASMWLADEMRKIGHGGSSAPLRVPASASTVGRALRISSMIRSRICR